MLSKTGVHHYGGSASSCPTPYDDQIWTVVRHGMHGKCDACMLLRYCFVRHDLIFAGTVHISASVAYSRLEDRASSSLTFHCQCSGVLTLNFDIRADNVELGTACGKLHRVSVLAITDPGVHLAAAHVIGKLKCCCWSYMQTCCAPAQVTRTS